MMGAGEMRDGSRSYLPEEGEEMHDGSLSYLPEEGEEMHDGSILPSRRR